MYADDTSVTCSSEDIDQLCNDLKADAEHIAECLRQSKLSLNTEKTEFLVVGNKQQTNHIIRPTEIGIYGESIKRVKKVKYVGITVDENLTWNEHYPQLNCKIKAVLLSLQQSKQYQVYKALFE